MRKNAVIFDMDGLMFDTQCIYDKAYDDVALKEYNFIVPLQMHLALMGSSGEDIINAAARYLPKGTDARSFIRQCFDRVAELVKTDLRARPGLDLILPYLSEKGYILGLASGSERAVVDSNLESTGLGHYFAATLCGDEVVHSKPDPESYTRVCAMIGCRPEESRTGRSAICARVSSALCPMWWRRWKKEYCKGRSDYPRSLPCVQIGCSTL